MDNLSDQHKPHPTFEQMEQLLCNLEDENFLEKLRELLSYDLVEDAGILVSVVISLQSMNNKSEAFAKIISILNAFIPAIGLSCGRRAVSELRDALLSRNFKTTYNMVSLIVHLIKFEVLQLDVAIDIVYQLLSLGREEILPIIYHVFCVLGKTLQENEPQKENELFDLLHDQLTNSNSSGLGSELLQKIVDLRKTGYIEEVESIRLPKLNEKSQVHLVQVDLFSKIHTNDSNLQSNVESEKGTSFSSIRPSLLVYLDSFKKQESAYRIDDMTDAEDMKLKKKIYLLLKSSLSGDEAAHKILASWIPDNSKNTVANVIAKACSQETTYSKFYGIIAERLCNKHVSWKKSFEIDFKKLYMDISDFEPSQIRNLGKFWGHVIATKSIDFTVFEVVKMNEHSSTPSNRVLLKFIFKELVAELGIDDLHQQLSKPNLVKSLSHMFPQEDEEDIMFSINYFTAIGLGILTTDMRERLNAIQNKRRESTLSTRNDLRFDRRSEENTTHINVHKSRMPLVRHRSRSPRRIRRSRSRTPPRQRNK